MSRRSAGAKAQALLGFAQIDPCRFEPGTSGCDLASRGVDVWAFSLAAHTTALEEWLRVLSVDERARAGRFRRSADRDHYIVAHGVLRRLLASYCGIEPRGLQLLRAGGGKPMVDRALSGPTIHFNLAHSGDAALLAITQTGEIGVDLEVARDDIDVPSLAERFFAGAERAAIAAAPQVLRTAAFFRYWVAKEAVLKAQGTGLAGSLDAFAIRFSGNGDTATITLAHPELSRADWQVRMLRMPPGWYGALCAQRDCRVRFRLPATPAG